MRLQDDNRKEDTILIVIVYIWKLESEGEKQTNHQTHILFHMFIFSQFCIELTFL